MIATEVLKPVFALVDDKVTLQEEREKVIRNIMDVLNAAKGLVSIDINDVRELFQEGGIIHTFDVKETGLENPVRKHHRRLVYRMIQFHERLFLSLSPGSAVASPQPVVCQPFGLKTFSAA